MKDVILSGYYGFDNLGDEAILNSIINMIKSFDQDINITVLSNSPEKTSLKYDVNSIYRYNIFEILSKMKQSDIFISGGGSLLQDVTSLKTIPYYLSLMFFAKLYKLKTAFFAQGVGPIRTNFYRFLIKKVLNNTDYISVRDRDSKKLLTTIGISEKNIKLIDDPVFLLTDKYYKDDIIEKGIKNNKLKIGVSVRNWRDNKYLDILADFLNNLGQKRNISINIFIFHNKEDIKVSKRLNEKLQIDSSIIDYTDDIDELNKIYREYDIVIGLRLHSLIFSAVNSIPFIGISYDPKVESLINEMDYQQYISTENIDGDILNDNFENIINNYKIVKEKIISKSRDKSNHIKDYLRSIIMN